MNAGVLAATVLATSSTGDTVSLPQLLTIIMVTGFAIYMIGVSIVDHLQARRRWRDEEARFNARKAALAERIAAQERELGL